MDMVRGRNRTVSGQLYGDNTKSKFRWIFNDTLSAEEPLSLTINFINACNTSR